MEKKKAGRKKGKSGMNTMTMIRSTENQKLAIVKMAREDGFTSVSNYILHSILEKQKREQI